MYVARIRWMLERQLSVASVQTASDKPCSRHSFSEALAPLTPSRCGPCSSSFSSTEACRRSPPGPSGWPWSRTQRLQTPEPSPPTSRPFSCRVGAESHGLSRFAALTGVGSSVWTCCPRIRKLTCYVVPPERATEQKGSRRLVPLHVNQQEANGPAFVGTAKIQNEARRGRAGSAW